jgi:hypothetical protein
VSPIGSLLVSIMSGGVEGVSELGVKVLNFLNHLGLFKFEISQPKLDFELSLN